MNLFELTNHESGIVVYQNGNVIVTNWGNYDDDWVPILSPLGLPMQWPQEDGYLDNCSVEHMDDIRAALPGRVWLTGEISETGERIADTDITILYDEFCDIARLFLGADISPLDLEGDVYTTRDGLKFIAPAMWN